MKYLCCRVCQIRNRIRSEILPVQFDEYQPRRRGNTVFHRESYLNFPIPYHLKLLLLQPQTYPSGYIAKPTLELSKTRSLAPQLFSTII